MRWLERWQLRREIAGLRKQLDDARRNAPRVFWRRVATVEMLGVERELARKLSRLDELSAEE